MHVRPQQRRAEEIAAFFDLDRSRMPANTRNNEVGQNEKRINNFGAVWPQNDDDGTKIFAIVICSVFSGRAECQFWHQLTAVLFSALSSI